MTKISWATKVWNPMHGCTKCSPGCDNCYAERMANRQFHMGTKGYENKFSVTLRPDRLDQPLKNKKPTVYFVCSMGDLFHEDVSDEFLDEVYTVMGLASQHIFLVLTKRSKRMAEYCKAQSETERGNNRPLDAIDCKKLYDWCCNDFPNVYHGVTVCNQAEADEKIPHLLQVPGKRFLSIEPMLGPVDLTKIVLKKSDAPDRGKPDVSIDALVGWYAGAAGPWPSRIHQVILGGESGPGARPMHPDWVRGVRDQCAAAGVPFMFKQWGEWGPAELSKTVHALSICGIDVPTGTIKIGKKQAGRTLDGEIHNELIWER